MRRRTSAVLGSALLAFSLASCAQRPDLIGSADGPSAAVATGSASSATVIESAAYGATVGTERQDALVEQLRDGVQRLRDASTSGWQLRQDDSTGVGGELSGGIVTFEKGTEPLNAARQFLADHGDLFGISDVDAQVLFDNKVVDSTDAATLRGVQLVRGVPVEGSSMLVVVRRVSGRPEIGFVRAHIFSAVDDPTPVDSVPTITGAQARDAAQGVGATPSSEPVLVITSAASSPLLAWKFDADYTPPVGKAASPRALSAGLVTVFVDAHTGEVVQLTRRAKLSLGAQQEGDAGGGAQLDLPEVGEPVKVSGTVRGGIKVTLTLERLADGSIAFIDASQPNADRTTGRGLNVVYDGAKTRGYDDLPGTIAVTKAGATPDADTLTAAWAAKTVLDYYRVEHGRASWDGEGAPLVSTVHMPARAVNCNAYFDSSIRQMVYGGPCSIDGKRVVDSMVDIAVVGHEITHGVTDSAAPLISESSGQGAALNEGNSDYFGVIIQNRALAKAYTSQGVSMCAGRDDSEVCHSFDDGAKGGRNIDSGAIFDDAEFLLREPGGLLDSINDIGGAHDNSMIWTSALWQIRKAFASEDGGDLLTSKAAARFDRIVYRAITTYFTNETDMPAAASAVLQAATDLGASGDELDVIQQQFVVSQLCLGCTTPASSSTAERSVAATMRIEHRPVLLDRGIAYVEQDPTTSIGGSPVMRARLAPLDGAGRSTALVAGDAPSFAVAGAGTWVVEVRFNAEDQGWYQLTNLATGKTERLGDFSRVAVPAVSKTTVVWATSDDGGKYTVHARATTGGAASTLPLDQRPMHLAVDGRLVAIQTEDGTLSAWDLAKGTSSTVGSFDPLDPSRDYPRPMGGLAVSGRRIAALGTSDGQQVPRTVALIDLDAGTTDVLSRTAFPAGVAIDGNHVVWSEVVGPQTSAIASFLGEQIPDSDLMVFTIDTGTYVVPFQARGQQGFPSIVGKRLAWQDSRSGADDIFTAVLPDGI